jgi:hypothetical protein
MHSLNSKRMIWLGLKYPVMSILNATARPKNLNLNTLTQTHTRTHTHTHTHTHRIYRLNGNTLLHPTTWLHPREGDSVNKCVHPVVRNKRSRKMVSCFLRHQHLSGLDDACHIIRKRNTQAFETSRRSRGV